MFFLKKIYRKFTNWRWEIGFVDNSFTGLVNGEPLKVHWVELPFRDRWFADPYILDYNDEEIIVLGEEYSDELLREFLRFFREAHREKRKSFLSCRVLR